MTGLWVLLAVAAGIGLAAIAGRRGLVVLAEQVRAAWTPVETELKRRHTQVAELLEAARGILPSEEKALEEIAGAWREASAAAEIPDRTDAENRLSDALGRLQVPAGAGADLGLEGRLQALAATQRQVAAATRAYNLRVMALNQRMHRFPWRLVARGFQPAEYLVLDEPDRQADPPASG